MKYYLLLTKDGLPRDWALPDWANKETLAIMVATAYGAARTLNSELNRSTPKYIKIYPEGEPWVIANIDKNYLLATQFDDNKNLEEQINGLLKDFYKSKS